MSTMLFVFFTLCQVTDLRVVVKVVTLCAFGAVESVE